MKIEEKVKRDNQGNPYVTHVCDMDCGALAICPLETECLIRGILLICGPDRSTLKTRETRYLAVRDAIQEYL